MFLSDDGGGMMLQRIGVLLFLAIFVMALTACIDVTIGNDIVKISEDGVQIIRDGANHEHDESKQSITSTSNKENGTNEHSQIDENEIKIEDFLHDDNSEQMEQLLDLVDGLFKFGLQLEKEFSTKATSEYESALDCPPNYNDDYSAITEKLNHSFFFPPCTEVIHVNDSEITLHFTLKQRSTVDTIHGNNQAYMKTMKKFINAYRRLGYPVFYDMFDEENGYAQLDFYLHGNDGETKVIIEHFNNYVLIDVTYIYP